MTGAHRGPVRKVFTESGEGGSDTAYWESTWDALDLNSEREGVLSGPVASRLDFYLGETGGPVLEAGCGTGAVAVALGTMGHQVVGLDLAEQTLRRARRTWPDFRGAVGDVRQMPFPDESFEAVISLGVLEHDETGPEGALAEHRRILRRGGILLVTVPRISPLKATRDLWNLNVMRRSGYESRGRWVVRRHGLFVEGDGRTFHQYEFRRTQWQALVRDAGFEILDSRPHGVGAGLGDLTMLPGRRSGNSRSGDATPPRESVPVGDGIPSAPRQALRSAAGSMVSQLKSAVTSETASNRLEGWLVSTSQFAIGHMDLTVARRV